MHVFCSFTCTRSCVNRTIDEKSKSRLSKTLCFACGIRKNVSTLCFPGDPGSLPELQHQCGGEGGEGGCSGEVVVTMAFEACIYLVVDQVESWIRAIQVVLTLGHAGWPFMGNNVPT